MNNYEFKINLISRLKDRDVFTQQVSDVQFRTRCPYCGDSQKNINTGHLYLKINPHDDNPIMYYCHKCPASGILKYSDLELLGLEGDELKNGISTLNQNAPSRPIEPKEQQFDFKLPEPNELNKLKYVERRLGRAFSAEELKKMKIITSFKHFLLLNGIKSVTCKPYLARLLEDKYVGFLSTNNSHILFRDITDSNDISWFKYPILPESIGQKVMYSIESSLDLYSDKDIIINLSEGVMDCLSVAYNLNNDKDNILNMAVCGKYYNKVIERLLHMGLVGDNVIINIYSDNDHTRDTSFSWYRKIFKRYRDLVKEINVYYNLLSKDCGVPPNRIKLKKYSL